MDDCIERFRLQTVSLLNQPDVWSRVEAVAGALLAKKSLSGAECRRILKCTLDG
jgi:hypothetical protein